MPIEDVVDVSISLETTSIPKAGFGIMMAMAAHSRWAERSRSYAKASEMLLDNFRSTDPAYAAAVKYFSAPNKPTSIVIGRRKVERICVVVIEASTAADVEYSITIDGVAYTHTTAGVESQATIAAALKVLIDAGDSGVTVTNPTSGVLFIDIPAASDGMAISTEGDIVVVDNISYKVTLLSVLEGGEYTITINGTEYAYTALGGDTADDVLSALYALINYGVDTSDLSIYDAFAIFDSDASELNIFSYANASLEISVENLTLYTESESVTDAYTAIKLYDSTWYGWMIVSRLQDDQEEGAEVTEADDRLFGISSANSDIIDKTVAADTTSIAAVLAAADYARTWGIYHPYSDGSQDDEWPEARAFGGRLTVDLDKDTATWKFVNLSGVTVYTLTTTQQTNILGNPRLGSGGKNFNSYQSVGGVSIMREGKVCAGEFIDTIIGRDWLKTRMQEAVYATLVNASANGKISFDDAGIGQIEGAARGVLQKAIQTKFLKFDTDKGVFGYYIKSPLASETDSTDRANRYLNGIEWGATLAGAIHCVDISGTISV